MGDYELVGNLVAFAVLFWGAVALDVARARRPASNRPPDRYALPGPDPRN
jgi:hypothetical protein